MKDFVFKIIDQLTEGVDTYHNNGSMWLIFTEDKKWVLELTQDGTLWYNFYFFQDCFKYLSLDVVENQHYITEWVEDIIQNGVKYTKSNHFVGGLAVEDAIQNGAKETNVSPTFTEYGDWLDGDERLDDIIQNGIKNTLKHSPRPQEVVEDIIIYNKTIFY